MSTLNFWSAFLPAASKGITSAASMKAGMGGGGGGGGAAAQQAGTSWIDQVLAGSTARPPEMAAQGADPSLLFNSDVQIPYRRPDDIYTSTAPQKQSRVQGTELQGKEAALRQLMLLSTRNTKKNIKKDSRSLREILRTPAVTYRYKDEPGSTPKRPGIIAEDAPHHWRGGPAGKLIKAPAWLGAQHGAIQALARKVQKLEKRA